MQKLRRTNLVVAIVVIVAVLFGVVDVIVLTNRQRHQQELKQIEHERGELKHLELQEEITKTLGEKMTPMDIERLRQLREREAKRNIERK